MLSRKLRIACAALLFAGTSHAASTFTDGVWYPGELVDQAVQSLQGQTLLDAAGEKHACIFRVSDTGSITDIGFRTGTVTSQNSLDVTLQTVDATTGFPNGSSSLYGGSSSGTVLSATVATNTGYTVGIGTASATKGDVVAAVVEFSSTTGNLNIAGFSSVSTRNPGSSYAASFVGTPSWSKSGPCNLWVKYSTGVYNYNDALQFAWTTVSATNYTSASSPNERGMKFSLTQPATLSGATIYFGTVGPSTVTFYDTDGTTPLSQVNIDTDTVSNSAGTYSWTFTTPVSVLANTTYRIAVKSITASNVALNDWSVKSAEIMGQIGGGMSFFLTTRAKGLESDAAAWTDTTTTRPYINLRITSTGSATGPKSVFIFE